ncbi:MAG: CotH kinase family protein, partial [Nitrososphaeraceae archaeon]
LYLLTERIDADMLELKNFNDNDEMHSSIFKSFSYATNDTRYWFNNGIPYLKEIEHIGFSQKEPNSKKQGEAELWGAIDTLYEFVIKSPADYFEKNFDKKFDIKNIIDFHLLVEITGSNDGYINNVYFYKENKATGKFFLAPWDYNLSFGRGPGSAQEDFRGWYSRVLFDRLMTIPLYRENLIKRWNNLKSDIFSSDNIIQMAKDNAKVIDDAQSRNFEKYPIVVGDDWRRSEYPDDNGFYEELNYFKEWVNNRVSFLDDYINYKINSSNINNQ